MIHGYSLSSFQCHKLLKGVRPGLTRPDTAVLYLLPAAAVVVLAGQASYTAAAC